VQKYGDRYGEWWEHSEEKMVAKGPLIVDFPRFALAKGVVARDAPMG
jgi:hypothetical protein